MAKNASTAGAESRIPVPRTVRPSLLPAKIRSCAPKICARQHRSCTTTKRDLSKTSSFCGEHTDSTDKECILGTEYSIWGADNKETDHHLIRFNDEQPLGSLRSQEEDLAKYGLSNKKKQDKQQSHEDISENLADEDYEIIESPATTTSQPYLMLTKQNSFEHEHDESLGILTPDQMTDFTVALDSSRTPSCENLSANTSNKFLHSKSGSEVVAAAARHLDLASRLPKSVEALSSSLNDRSPSLEELPLDPKPVVIIAEDVELLEASLSEKHSVSSTLTANQNPKALVTVDSSETSEHTSDQTTRSTSVAGAHVLPTSFITSVTSITSLEAGYQGDGENSRPASRGPEPLSVAAVTKLVVGASRQDPMTDSDFFTESDVDGHEDIVRGDRRAQVIDGTLFCAPHDKRCLSFEPEEMDSSGIYSDLEKRQDGVVGDADADGDHTTDTGDTEISLKSQPSPHDQPPVALVIQNALSPSSDVFNLTNDLNSTASTGEVTVIKCQKNEQNTATKSKSSGISNKENSAPLKKYKMPKRNVSSKIKTMIEANNAKEETESEPKKPQRQQRKNGRWEAVMNKIEAGKQRSRPQKKEIKSRVFEGLSATQVSSSKRRTRTRPDTSNSPNQDTARSSVRSSASDLSNALSKEILKRPQQQQQQQQQQRKDQQPNNVHQYNSQINSNKSNLAPVRKSTAPSIKSVHQSNANSKQKNNSPATPNKVTERCNNRAGPKDAEANLKNHHNTHQHIFGYNNNNNINNNKVQQVSQETRVHQVDTREQESQVDLSMVLEEEEDDDEDPVDSSTPPTSSTGLESEFLCERADKTIQALAITVQYLNNQIDSARVENASLRLKKNNAEEKLNLEREEHRKCLENLNCELSQANLKEKDLESQLCAEQCQKAELEESLARCEREHRETLERIAVEHEAELNHARSQAQQPREHASLLAEIESLRTVLELRSQEYATLRSEADLLRREMDDKEVIRHKYESVQARCEDLQAQLQSKEEAERKLLHEHEVLMGSIHQMSKQTKRLNQKNEELYWRLRHKNETMSALQNQLVPHQPVSRLSRSLDSENDTDSYQNHDQSMNCSQKSDAYETASCSMIKYMIEKSDSVSWTLDITDDLDSSCHSPGLAEKNGIKRQNSLRLSNQRRTLTPNRSRSSSVAAPTANDSIRKAAAAAAARVASVSKKEAPSPTWSPTFNSTPNPKSAGQRRRTIADAGETSWSLSNNIMESSSGGNIVRTANSSKVMTALEVLTDEDEEALGQRPQEAGGEAMISEETSATSSSEEDDSSVSSGDIP